MPRRKATPKPDQPEIEGEILQPVVNVESLEPAPIPVVMRFDPDPDPAPVPAPVPVVEPVVEEINSRSFMPELDQAPISAIRDQRRSGQPDADFQSPPPQQRGSRRNFRTEPEPDFEAPPPPDPNRRNYRAEPEPDFEASPPRRQPMPPSNFSRTQPTVAPRDDFSATAPAPTPGSYVSPALTQQRGFAPGNDWDEPAPTANATAPRSKRFFDMASLQNENLAELRERAKNMGVQRYTGLKKDDLIVALLRMQAEKQGLEYRGGVMDIIDENVGFLRAEHYLPGPEDIYVSPSQIRRFGLRTGDMVFGQVRAPKDNEKFYSLLRVEAINGLDPEQAKDRRHFEKLTPIFPNKMFDLEKGMGNKWSTRLINLLAPIGRGQRGLIVAPPKVGKTTILKDIANAISTQHRDVHLMIALIAERPEEATDMDRSVEAEVVASTFDERPEAHVRVAEMVIARAKRLVESGRDVVILLDSLTRLARAYNLVVPSSGRTLSGGVDPAAMYPIKEFYGAARNIEEGGSLTIIATVLVETGSRMDEYIFEEFKGTGNMELHLSRKLSDRRIFPAIDIERSATRREELLLGEKMAKNTYLMRQMFSQLTMQPPHGAGYDQLQAMQAFLSRFGKTKTNEEFLTSLTG